jgi:Zn finger protein HypA/HybF involved in hydrogenase expression
MKKMNTITFCNKSNIKHNNRYDYSLVNYINNRTKVKIICKKHGIFEQIPDSHMRGFGCTKCSGNYKYTNNEFIEKVKTIFKEKYIYEKIEYISQKNKVLLICKIHGEFLKFPQILLRGSGCGRCETKNYKIDTDEFIKKSIKIHSNNYDYKNVLYINDYTPVKIICKTHGEFEQTPNTHLSGSGCIICSGRYRYSNEDFINKSISIHGNRYDYSLVDYHNSHKKVIIKCIKHGNFTQKPNSHLLGRGCPSCKESKGEILISNFLNENNIDYIRQKTFDGCKSKSLLFFDFYIPNINLCIEYDGEFHYRPIFGEKYLKDTIFRDNIKNIFCKQNNIELIRIKYTEFSNIENILKNKLLI